MTELWIGPRMVRVTDMDQCDSSRVAEIEKAVVEQAHCYLPNKDGFRVPSVDPCAGYAITGIVIFVLVLLVGMVWLMGFEQGHNTALDKFILKRGKRG